MEKNEQNINFGNEIESWVVPEYDKHERSKKWYIFAISVSILLLAFALLTSNFLFAVIVVIAAIVIILNDGREPERVKVSITGQGILVGKKFYDYDKLKNFSVIFKPQEQTRNIYFEFKFSFKQRLSIPLENKDPLQIREILLKYLPEDLERTNAPLSEGLAKLFKL